jgi:hypothetical protein
LAVAVVYCIVLLSIKSSGISIEEESQIKTHGTSTLLHLKKVVPWCGVAPRTIEDTMDSFIEGNRDEFDGACKSIQDDLNNKMRASLRKAGLVIVENSNLADEQTAYLQVRVTVRKIDKNQPIYAFSVNVQLSQLVQLVRNPKIRTTAETWPNAEAPNIMFVAGFYQLEQAIRKEATAQLDKFIEDYLAANQGNANEKRPFIKD